MADAATPGLPDHPDAPWQGSLFGHQSPALAPLDPSRIWLDHESWIDRQATWLLGGDRLCHDLQTALPWEAGRRPMYDRMVDVPRLVWFSDKPEQRVEGLADLRRRFEDHYCRRIRSVSANWYRDGQDSVEIHPDRVPRPGDTIVAILSLGGRRPVVVKPDNGGPSQRFVLGHGDLFVMGGPFQATHQHGVPKVTHSEPRISVMFRT